MTRFFVYIHPSDCSSRDHQKNWNGLGSWKGLTGQVTAHEEELKSHKTNVKKALCSDVQGIACKVVMESRKLN